MKPKNLHDEYLEQLWYMLEANCDKFSVFHEKIGDLYDKPTLSELIDAGLVSFGESTQTISLTFEGKKSAQAIIRSHRLSERLIADVLRGEFETGACEFEHMINPMVVDSICTLLGHPRLCPHGKPIPEGECCRQKTQMTPSAARPVTELEQGEKALIAYVQSKDDLQLHRLDGLQIRPGVEITLHQKNPTFVVECEGAHIALDTAVAENIFVWRPQSGAVTIHPHEHKKRRRFWHRGGHGCGHDTQSGQQGS